MKDGGESPADETSLGANGEGPEGPYAVQDIIGNSLKGNSTDKQIRMRVCRNSSMIFTDRD